MSKNINEKELNRLIEIASLLANKDKVSEGIHTLDDIKIAARDLGIPPDKIEQAYQMMQEEKRQRRQKIQNTLIALLLSLVIGAGTFYWLRPVHFEGSLQNKIASRLTNEGFAADELNTLYLFQHNTLYCFTTLYGLEHPHELVWELYSPKSEMMARQTYQLSKSDAHDGYQIYAPFQLSLSYPPGQWKIKIYADKKPIGEKTVNIERGPFIITMASQLDDKYVPLDALDTFSKAKHPKIYCHGLWPMYNGEHEMEWKWIDEKGKLGKNFLLSVKREKSRHWAYHSVNTTGMAPGRWNVEIYLDGILIGEKSFHLTD